MLLVWDFIGFILWLDCSRDQYKIQERTIHCLDVSDR